MYTTIKFIIATSAIVLATACASVPDNHIDMSAREHINEVDAYLAVTQDEIYADIDRSNSAAAAGGGLLFALIDSAVDNSRTKNAEELIQPIRDSLIDFDYAELLQTNLEEKLNDVEWMTVKKVQLERSIGDGLILDKVKKSEVSAVLFMTADYKLTPDFDGVITSIAIIMFPNKAALYKFKEELDNNENPVDQADNIYRNNIIVRTPLGLQGNKDENAQHLQDTKAMEVKDALEKSAKQIAQDIFDDIQRVDDKN